MIKLIKNGQVYIRRIDESAPITPATNTEFGGIKVGQGLLIDANGVLSEDPEPDPEE